MEFPKINTLVYFSAIFMLSFDAFAQNNAIEEVIVSAEKRMKVFKMFQYLLQH